ncbi:uncharacterized protein LOC116290786 isoform X2 [Actinia tenebrosa]|uniref:Uncharacterized protein LOC116290786 isoform X2 n=1 Tax=Actinia tenebrosa TaxID=6105 RepID=A0A6P8HM87_ACTTE|nr:uncharacterized protein LOC116290786 isoform X2 [Actinia tenebrosa]
MSRMEELLLENEERDVTEGHTSAVQVVDEVQPTNEAYERQNEEVKGFEYDVFISYSKSDRPWVKDVLLQALEQKARVLPLILIECGIPKILKHLTYLDHTSEDVQPYFKEQLIDSLDNAKKWTSPDRHGSDIVPISEVQQVVTRSLDQDKRRETAINKLMGAFSSFQLLKRRILVCIACPCIMFLVAFLMLIALYIYFMVDQKFVITPLEPTSVNSTATNVFVAFQIKNSVAKQCEVLRMTNKYSGNPFLVDTFGFEDLGKKVLYDKEKITHFVTSLSPKKMFKQKRFRIHGDMSVTTKFCFRSNQNASLRLYKPTSTHDVNQFDKTIDARVKYEDYTSIGNETFCGTSVIKGQSLTSNEFSAFVFKNVANTMIFLNLTTIFKTPNCKKSLAVLTCRNVSECQLPSSPRISYIIVSKNISARSYFGADEIEVKCVYKIPVLSNSIASVGIFLMGILFLCLIIMGFNKKCRPRLQKWYFGRNIVREKLGETAVQMIVDSPDLEELSKTIKQERENKEFTI